MMGGGVMEEIERQKWEYQKEKLMGEGEEDGNEVCAREGGET